MDSFNNLWTGSGIVAIFECQALFVGPNVFKPKELMIFTTKGLRISAAENLTFNIPIERVERIHAHFSVTSESMISINVTTSFAKAIKRAIESYITPELVSPEARFTRITMICERLPNATEQVLRTLFPSMKGIDEEKKIVILSILKPAFYKQFGNTTLAVDRKVNEESTEEEKALVSQKEMESLASVNQNESNLETEHPPVDDNRTILLYQHDEGAITLTVGDYTCLAPKEYLNDKIIDFYLKWIHNNVIATDEKRQKVHIFSSFFYHVLSSKILCKTEEIGKLTIAEQRHGRVKNWTKNVNIFNKDFIIIPINENFHWYLVIICFAGMVEPFKNSDKNTQHLKTYVDDEIVKKPVILILNSMESTTNYRQTTLLRDYLNCEYQAKIQNDMNTRYFTKETMPGHRAKVPQQRNLYDCGLYVLQFVEHFFTMPIKDFSIPLKNLRGWFDAITIKRKRQEIATLIRRLITQNHDDMGTRFEITLPNLN